MVYNHIDSINYTERIVLELILYINTIGRMSYMDLVQ